MTDQAILYYTVSLGRTVGHNNHVNEFLHFMRCQHFVLLVIFVCCCFKALSSRMTISSFCQTLCPFILWLITKKYLILLSLFCCLYLCLHHTLLLHVPLSYQYYIWLMCFGLIIPQSVTTLQQGNVCHSSFCFSEWRNVSEISDYQWLK